jgi:hypothetical protein
MRAQCLQHLPDVSKGRIVESRIRVGIGAEEHWKDDGPHFFVGCLADRPPKRLDDVNRRAAWIDEGNAIDAWHVYAFSKTASVAEQTTLVRRELAKAQK